MKVYSFDEFFHKRDIKAIDKVIGHIRKHKRLYQELIIAVAVFGMMITPAYAAPDKTERAIYNLTQKALFYAKLIISAIVLLRGLSEIGNHGAHGDLKGAFKSAMQYGGILAIFFMYPMFLDMIKEAFGQ